MDVISGLRSPSSGSRGDVLEKEPFLVTRQHPLILCPGQCLRDVPGLHENNVIIKRLPVLGQASKFLLLNSAVAGGHLLFDDRLS